jgi:hypothetical protein
MKNIKNYTIRFVYAGINQYANFKEIDGKIINPYLPISYAKASEVPTLDGLETIEEILEVIKSISYCNRAEIYLVNNEPIFYNVKTNKTVNLIGDRFKKFRELEAITFFEKHIEPIIKKNKIFITHSNFYYLVLIEKNKDGEWDNARDSKTKEINYLAYKFLNQFNKIKIDLTPQSNIYIKEFFCDIANLMPEKYFETRGLYIDLK